MTTALDTSELSAFSLDFARGSTAAQSYFLRSALVVDLDHDGRNEVVFSISPYPQRQLPLSVIGVDSIGARDLTAKYFPGGAPAVMHSPITLYKDVSGDGLPDIVAADAGLDGPPWTGSRIGVAINQGNGTFRDVSSLVPATILRNYAIAISDFNGDGVVDILLPDVKPTYQGDPSLLDYVDGSFRAIANPFKDSGELYRNDGLSTADFNGDGHIDLLASGDWTFWHNAIYYGGASGLDLTKPSPMPAGPLGEGYEYRDDGWPPTKIVPSATTSSITLDFNADGRPDIFSVQQDVTYYPPGMLTDHNVGGYETLLRDGGQVNGKSSFFALANVDGTEFSLKLSAQADLGHRFYFTNLPYDINGDGATDVIGYYFTVQYAQLRGQLWGTTFFINDGVGNFSVIDANDLFPELRQAPYSGRGDLRTHVGAIFPVSNGVEGFHGLQLISAADMTGPYGVREFIAPQLTAGNLAPSPIAITDRERISKITMYAMNDVVRDLNPAPGATTIDGGAGVDLAIYSGRFADYTIQRLADGRTTVEGGMTRDSLLNMERLRFADRSVAIDLALDASAGKTVKMIGAAFGNAILQRADYVGIGLQLFDGGETMVEVAQRIVDANLLPGSDEAFVGALWLNVMGTPVGAATRDYLTGLLNSRGGSLSRADLLVIAAESQANVDQVGLAGLATIDYVG